MKSVIVTVQQQHICDISVICISVVYATMCQNMNHLCMIHVLLYCRYGNAKNIENHVYLLKTINLRSQVCIARCADEQECL